MSSESVALPYTSQVSARLPAVLIGIGSIAVLGVAQGLPWIIDLGPIWSWCSAALALFVVTRVVTDANTVSADPKLTVSAVTSKPRAHWLASWWATLLWCTLWIAIAFYWSPAAMAYTLSSEYWLGLIVAAPLVLWDGLRMAGGFYLAARTTRDIAWIWLPAAIFIIAIETFVPSVFPWRIGLMQLSWPWLTQSVDIFGSSITTMVLFAHAGLLLQFLAWFRGQTVTRAAWICSGSLITLNAAYGITALAWWQSSQGTAQQIQVALVQVDPSYTESTANLRRLTEQVAKHADLVCWPESSGGSYASSLNDLSKQEQVFECSREPERGLQPWPSPRCELLLGGKNFEGPADEPACIHVTAMLVDKQEQITGRYHKRFLMPFGEYVPFENTIPGLAALFDMSEHVQPGNSAEPIISQTGARIGAMLCYEDMVSRASIDLTRQRANLLVSLINGSAFENPVTLRQHRLLAQLRATECRKTLLRCAATGETCVVLPTGEISQRLPLQTNDVLVAQVPLCEGQSCYTRLPWLANLLTIIGLVAVVICRRLQS